MASIPIPEISIPTVREKLVTTNANPTRLTIGEIGLNDSNDKITIPVISSVAYTPEPITVGNVNTLIGENVITTTGTFAGVRIGDFVIGAGLPGEGLPLAQVMDIAPDLKSLFLTTTVSGSFENISITIQPPEITPTYYEIVIGHSAKGDDVVLNLSLVKYSGVTPQDPTTTTKTIPLVPGGIPDKTALVIDTEGFLSNLRIAKTV